MSRNRPRGLFRAAALLAVGASPLLVGAASAAEAPSLDGVEGKLGTAPQLDTKTVERAGQIADGRTVQLPASVLPKAPDVLALPDAPTARELRAAPVLPETDVPEAGLPKSGLPKADLPKADLPDAQTPNLGSLPVPLPSLG